MELKGKTINFLGDSITEGAGTSGPEKIYPAVIARNEGLKVARNYGIGGTRIARQTGKSAEEKFDLDFCMRVDEMDPHADAVVVFGGTNDWGHGDAFLGCMNDRTPWTFYGALHFQTCALPIWRIPPATGAAPGRPPRRFPLMWRLSGRSRATMPCRCSTFMRRAASSRTLPPAGNGTARTACTRTMPAMRSWQGRSRRS